MSSHTSLVTKSFKKHVLTQEFSYKQDDKVVSVKNPSETHPSFSPADCFTELRSLD